MSAVRNAVPIEAGRLQDDPESVSKSIPVAEWSLSEMPGIVHYHDKVLERTISIDTADDEWEFWYNGTHLWIKFDRFQPQLRQLMRTVCASYVQQSGSAAELSKVTRLYSVDVLRLLETPLAEVKIWWASNPAISGRISVAMSARTLLRWCITHELGHWARASQSLLNSLHSNYNQLTAIDNRNMVLSASSQAAITRALDRSTLDVSSLTDVQLAGLVSLAWSFQHGMRPVQQISVRRKDVRLYVDSAGVRQAHLVFHKAKQRVESPEPLIRQMKTEWVPLLEELMQRHQVKGAASDGVLGFANTPALAYRQKIVLKDIGISESLSPYHFRHTAAQMLADAGHPRELIQEFLGHSTTTSAKAYIRASINQAELLNRALGASDLYQNIEAIAVGRFASIDEIENAPADNQIGGVVGTTPIAGLGLCSTGQPSCAYNPISSCYGCERFIPSADRRIHNEALAGMREHVLRFEKSSRGEENGPAYIQLSRPIAVAQQTLKALDDWEKRNA